MSNEVILRFLADTKQLDAAYAKIVGKTSAMDRVLQSIGGFGTAATKAGRSLTHGVTVPILAIGTAAGVLGYKWDQTWTRIKSLTDLTGQEIERARQKVLSLGGTGVAPQKLAEGFYFLASAGLSADKAIDALDVSAKGASVGLGEFDALAQTVSTAMIVWQKQNLTAAQSVDTIVAAVKAGKMEPDRLATNLGKVAGQAAAAGVSLRELAGGMAQLTNAGQSPEAAAVNIGSLIKNIVAPSKQAQAKAKELGLSYDHLRETLRSKGLIAALGEMEQKAHGNRTAIALLLNKNVQASRGFEGLRGNMAQTQETMKKMSEDTGSLGRALQETAQSPAHRLQVALGKIQAAGIKWGEVILPKVADVADKVSTLADKFSKLTPEQQQAALKFAAIAAAAGPVLYVMGKLASGVALVGTNLKSAGFAAIALVLADLYAKNEDFRRTVNDLAGDLGKLGGWLTKHKDLVVAVSSAVGTYVVVTRTITAVTAAWTVAQTVNTAAMTFGTRALAVYRMGVAVAAMQGKSLVIAQGAMAVAQWALNAAFWACPVTWVVAALALLVGGFIYAWKHSETFRNVMKDTWQTTQRVTGVAIQAIMPMLKLLTNVWLTQTELMVKGAAKLFGWVPGIGPKLKQAAAEFDNFKSTITGVMDSIATSAAGWGRSVNYEYVNGIRTSNSALIAAAANSAKAVKDAYADPDKYFREAGKQNVSAYAAGMRDNAKKAATTAASIAKVTEDEAKKRALTFMPSVGAMTTGQYVTGVGKGVPAARAAGATVAGAARSGMDITGTFQGLGRDAAHGYAVGISINSNPAVLAAKAMARQAAAALQKMQQSNSPSKVTMALGRDFGSGYRVGITAAQAGISNAASDTAKKAAEALRKATAKVASERKDLWDAQHPGKDSAGKARKASPTVVRHQKEQLDAALKVQRDAAAKLRAAQAEDAELRNRRMAGLWKLGHAEQALGPWLSQVQASTGPVQKAAADLAASITKSFADKRGVLPTAVAKMRDQLLQLSKDAGDLHKEVFDNLLGGASLTSAFSGKDVTSGDMKMFLARKVQDMQALGDGLTQLSARGLPIGLLKQLAQGGTDALPMVRSLLGASSTDFAAIASSQRRVEALANSTASVVESSVYGRPAAAPTKSVNVGTVNVHLAATPGTDGKQLMDQLLAELKALGGA